MLGEWIVWQLNGFGMLSLVLCSGIKSIKNHLVTLESTSLWSCSQPHSSKLYKSAAGQRGSVLHWISPCPGAHSLGNREFLICGPEDRETRITKSAYPSELSSSSVTQPEGHRAFCGCSLICWHFVVASENKPICWGYNTRIVQLSKNLPCSGYFGMVKRIKSFCCGYSSLCIVMLLLCLVLYGTGGKVACCKSSLCFHKALYSCFYFGGKSYFSLKFLYQKFS